MEEYINNFENTYGKLIIEEDETVYLKQKIVNDKVGKSSTFKVG